MNSLSKNIGRLAIDIVIVYLTYVVCQIAFVMENIDSFRDSIHIGNVFRFFVGGLHFTTSAVCYTNILFIVLFATAFFFRKEVRWYAILLKYLYVVVNGICVVVNLADSAFFRYRLSRSTSAVFSEFEGEGNLMKIMGGEILSHWYFILLAAVLVYLMVKTYRSPLIAGVRTRRYYIASGIAAFVIVYLAASGMRGFFISPVKGQHPISNQYAFRYTDTPVEAGIVLNTPFSIIRTTGKKPIPTPDFFSAEELSVIYSPLHIPEQGVASQHKNIVVLILESFSREFVGGLNQHLRDGSYEGYTPNLDAMLDSCMWFDEMIANTAFSIDACPAVLASIPRGDTPFVLSNYAVNKINSLASELKKVGYTSSFFLGAQNHSMGICDFIRQAGFDSYNGLDEYLADKRFGGIEDHDGLWGIWDEPFLQYFCTKLGELPQPFLGTLFTLSSHHPFKVPEKYKDVFRDGSDFEVEKCIRYTDYALGRFFEEARKQPWFKNTIFVLTADHASGRRGHDEYKNDMGDIRIPILFYDPSGELPRGCQSGIAQQIDIMPTLLHLVGYDKPYIAFGKNLLLTNADDSWAFNWNSVPVYIKGSYRMVSDGQTVVGLYDYKKDPDCETNLLGTGIPEEKIMERNLKAIEQSYMDRMNTNRLTVGEDEKVTEKLNSDS